MRKTTFLFPVLIVLATILFAFSSPALADDDPPGRVARLNYIQGSISFQPGGSSDWVEANPNRPLTTGDNLWADRGSRGELHLGSTSIRIGGETGITFLNLDDRTTQVQLAQGSLNVHVRRMEGGDAFEIDTPNIAFTLERPGEYRVDVDPNGSATTVTVRGGEGEATGAGNEYHMDTGDQVTFSGTESLTYDRGEAGRYDDFDSWCRTRDEREERASSARYVSRDVIGYEDLDDYGEWRNVPDYGYVWFPARVAPGWAPYRFGHWVWISPWGWTWVEDEPWGFAPFHYGRWAVFSGSWCWVPGPVVVRPVYAPALVVFVGGPRFNVAVGGGGGMAWFPLGPREVYVPPYRTSERYVQNVNVTNTTVNVVNVTNVYNNVTVNNTRVNNITYMHQTNVQAVTAVSHDTFVNARPVAVATVRVNPEQMRAAEVQRTVAVAPVQKSVVGAAPPAAVRPPQAVMQRQVVAKEVPPPVRPAIATGTTGQAVPQVRPQVRQLPPVTTRQSIKSQPQQQQAPAKVVQQAPSQPQIQQTPAHPQTQFPPQQQQQRSQPQVQEQARPGQPPQGQAQPQTHAPQTTEQAPRQLGPAPNSPEGKPSVATPPPQQNPNVKMAPPAKANENTYQPHQFEKPPAAAPPQNQRPQERAPEPSQERGQPRQEQRKPENEKDKEKK
jgi:hypothetical protein